MAWTGTESSFQGFIDKHGLTFPNISDDPGDVFARFGVPYQPALVVLDASGNAQQILGAVNDAQLDEILSGVAG